MLTGCAVLDPPPDTPPREELSGLSITEIQYNPLPESSVSEDSLEFIELFNKGDKTISLEQVSFDDGIEFTFPAGSFISSGDYIVLASSAGSFQTRYGFAPYGVYSGSLKNSGERIALRDLSVGKDFLVIEYSDQGPWPEKADGQGYSMVVLSSDAMYDLSDATSWRASTRMHGSPGKADPAVVYINEVLTHTDPPDQDAIELFNPGNIPVDISGWFLSDSRSNPKKFRIPDGTEIGPHAFKVFYSEEFNDPSLPSPFNLDANGEEEIYLFADSTDFVNGFHHGFPFDAIVNGVSFGRHINSSGQERFTTFSSVTLGSANSSPASPSVVISEIMYNPPEGLYEYVEITNTSSETVYFYDSLFPQNTWILKGFGFTFPADSIKSGEKALLISDTLSPIIFRSAYNISSDVVVFSGASGALRNSGDTLTLMSPEEPFLDGYMTIVPYKVEERVEYCDEGAWPLSADGQGRAIVRKDLRSFADDAANWQGEVPSPGR